MLLSCHCFFAVGGAQAPILSILAFTLLNKFIRLIYWSILPNCINMANILVI